MALKNLKYSASIFWMELTCSQVMRFLFMFPLSSRLSLRDSSSVSLWEISDISLGESRKTKSRMPSSTRSQIWQFAMYFSSELSCWCTRKKYMVLSPIQYMQIAKASMRWPRMPISLLRPMGSLQTRSSMVLDRRKSRPQATSSVTMRSWKQERKKEVRSREEMSMEQKEAMGKGMGSKARLASSCVISLSSPLAISHLKLMQRLILSTLKYSETGRTIFPRQMTSTEKQRSSRGVVALGACVVLTYWEQTQTTRGLMDKLRKMNRVSFLTRLSILLVLVSCFSMSQVVQLSRLTMKKLMTKTNALLMMEEQKLCTCSVPIQYWNIMPQSRMAKLMQKQAIRLTFLVQQLYQRFSQSMSSGSGASMTEMRWPRMALFEQQVQHLQNSLESRLVWQRVMNRSLYSSFWKVRKTKSSRLLGSRSWSVISLALSVSSWMLSRMVLMWSQSFEFLCVAWQSYFFSRKMACRQSLQLLAQQVNTIFQIPSPLKAYLISATVACRWTLESIALRLLILLTTRLIWYLHFLRQPRMSRMVRVKLQKQAKRMLRFVSTKPSWMVCIPQLGTSKWKVMGWTVEEKLSCPTSAAMQKSSSTKTAFTAEKQSGIQSLIVMSLSVLLQMGICLLPTFLWQQGQRWVQAEVGSQIRAASWCNCVMTKSGGIWYILKAMSVSDAQIVVYG